ncbi:hypothetical protein FCM35_KLT19047 [Carex littledalei]|uniref:Uncharacterized protein n=1 Tax=Carex littledalei TaxID=544730 RepID=A0A833VF36_9POAL|nr:hypothetical protein FCM35_KLT19047 [Carex littledalei]
MYRSCEQLDPSLLSSTPMTADNLLSFAGPATAKEYIFKLNCNCNKFTDVRPSATNSICESCGKSCSYTTLSYTGPSVTKKAVERDRYVKDGVTYFVMDDLSVVHLTPLESIALLNKTGHKNLSLLEEKTVTLDVQQGLELLKTSFRSKNVLTDMFLAKDKEALAEDSDLDMILGFSFFD